MGDVSKGGRWMQRSAQAGAPLLLAMLALSAGCSLLVDTEKDQCSVDEDCTELFGPTAPYVCSHKVCERPACESDEQCKERGGAFATAICSESERLGAPAECTDNAQCGVGQTCDTATNRCAKREWPRSEGCLANESNRRSQIR